MVFLISTACLVAAPVFATAALVETTVVVGPVIAGSATAATSTAATAIAVAEGAGLAAELATATTLSGASATSAIAAVAGPVGWFVLGAESRPSARYSTRLSAPAATFDCWKAVVRCRDPTPSQGRRLNEVLADPHVAGFCQKTMTITNIWGEVFAVTPVHVPCADGSALLALHATKQA
jgi:hypothetical protein